MNPEGPRPGDMLVSLVPMRAWEDDDRRGESGAALPAGQNVLVVDAWEVGRQRRIRVVYDGRVVVFSCAQRVMDRNWKAAREW